MAWWQQARFGLFIHWGLYAIPAGRWKGKSIPGVGEWIQNRAGIPPEEYAKLKEDWNPKDFDAKEWARVMKDAGVRYFVITSKHHDGFCLFDSKWTEFDVMETPFRRDILKELAKACRAEGIRIGWYHSIMDWHHPDYLPRHKWDKRSTKEATFEHYVHFLRNQVTELLSNYGPIDIMWFDGEWETTWTHKEGKRLYELCRSLAPHVLINNRVDKGRRGMQGMTAGERFKGDFGTPEQRIPPSGLPGVSWETCMTMNTTWGYKKEDHKWKSPKDLIRKLVDIASKGGNFLLNVGPTAEGRFPRESLARLRVMGNWLRLYGESIYGTQASPLAALPFGRATWRPQKKGGTLYLHIFSWPRSGQLLLPKVTGKLEEIRVLGGTPLFFQEINQGILLKGLPLSPPDSNCSVLALRFAQRPKTKKPIKIACIGDSITFGAGIQDREHSSWPALLGSLLGPNYTVQNAGVSARTLLKEGDHPIWKEKVFLSALASSPQAVLISLGTNDTKLRNWKHWTQLEPDLREMVKRVQALPSNPRIILCLPPPAWTRGKGINGERLSKGLIPIIRKVARETSCELLDFYTPCLLHPSWFPDGVHPNPFGTEMMAQLAYKALIAPQSTSGKMNFATIPSPSVEFRGKSAGWGGGTWWDQFSKINKLAKKHPNLELVFLGDSITQGLTGAADRISHQGGKRVFDRFFGSYKAAGFGISGDRCEHLLFRIDQGNLDHIQPKLIVLMIGINNLGGKKNTGKQVAAGTKAIVAALRKKQPQAHILILGCLPSQRDPASWCRHQIDILHERISALANQTKVHYLDLRRAFVLPSGKLNSNLFRRDQIHLNQKGYRVLTHAITPTIQILLGKN
jgi:alpha-L-fucosidase